MTTMMQMFGAGVVLQMGARGVTKRSQAVWGIWSQEGRKNRRWQRGSPRPVIVNSPQNSYCTRSSNLRKTISREHPLWALCAEEVPPSLARIKPLKFSWVATNNLQKHNVEGIIRFQLHHLHPLGSYRRTFKFEVRKLDDNSGLVFWDKQLSELYQMTMELEGWPVAVERQKCDI